MDYSEKNKSTLMGMQGMNQALSNLTIEGNELIFGEQRVDISKFDIAALMTDELPFASQLSTLTPEDVYKIISLHAITIASQTPTLAEDKNKKELEALKAKNPNLKNVVISTRKTNDGRTEEYINIVDSTGKDHLLHNVYKLDLIQMYAEALQRIGSSDITPEQLYAVFSERCSEVSLEDTYDMLHRSTTSEEFSTKMKDFEEKHLDDKHYAMGNEEHDILISNDHTVTSYDRDEEGNLIQRDFGDSTTTTGELNGDNTTDSTLAENAADEALQVKEEEQKAIDLISQERFYELVNSDLDLSAEEMEQINLFNSYLEDLMVYRDYLLPELREILAKYEELIEQYAMAESLNTNQSNELQKYYEMRDKKDERLSKTDTTAIGKDVQRLKLIMPEKEGIANSTAIILIMSLLVMLVGIIAVIIIK